MSQASEAEQAPGTVIDQIVIPPRGKMAREVKHGETLRIVDVEGQQVGDFVAFNLHNLDEKFWLSNTIRLNKTVYLSIGHTLYSELSQPMFTITADTCGRHDLLAGSCNAEIDKVRYNADQHYGCVENFVAALSPYGLVRKDIPHSFNIFMNCPIGADGHYEIIEPTSKAGDYIDLRAEMNCLIALSNCPQDLNPCNSGELKPLKVFIYASKSA